MRHYDVTLESTIIKYLFKQIRNNDYPYLKLVKAICDKLLPHLKQAVEELRCPYCGRTFSTKGALKVHLTRTASKLVIKGGARLRYAYSVPTNPCAVNFQLEIQFVIDLYRKFKEHLLSDSSIKDLRYVKSYVAFPKWVESQGIKIEPMRC